LSLGRRTAPSDSSAQSRADEVDRAGSLDADARRARPRTRRLATVLGIAGVVIAADQVTKSLALSRLSHGPVHVVGPLSFELAYNSGVAFSLFTGLTVPIVLAVLSIAGLLAWLARGVPSASGTVALGMILGGACGNLSDRLFRGNGGSVVDFVHLGFWPTFNVADASIVCGCVVLAIGLWQPQGPTGMPVDGT